MKCDLQRQQLKSEPLFKQESASSELIPHDVSSELWSCTVLL